MEEIKEAELQKYLTNYQAQYQLIKSARYAEGCLKAELIPFIYPFTNEDSDYVNATQLHLFHAGLFSNVYDVAVIMQMLLNGETLNGKSYLQKEFTD